MAKIIKGMNYIKSMLYSDNLDTLDSEIKVKCREEKLNLYSIQNYLGLDSMFDFIFNFQKIKRKRRGNYNIGVYLKSECSSMI